MKLLKVKPVLALVGALSLPCHAANVDNFDNIDNIDQPGWRAQVIALAKANFKHPAWGFSHCVRDYDLAKTLALQDKVALDDDVLFAAAYLHDMAMFPKWEKPGVDHADQAAAMVDQVLNVSGFPSEKIDMVRQAIKTHMFNRDAAGAESIYLHDADALDWLGAIGIVRTFSMIAAQGGQPDARRMVAVLETYIKDVPDHVISPAGKIVAAQRHDEANRFLTQLKSESADLHSL